MHLHQSDHESLVVGERSSAEWAAHIAAELAALPDVRILPRTTVVGSYDDGTYSALERVNDHVAEPPEHEPRQRLWRIFAKRCVLAAGAIERSLVFGDNDRPGVMLAGAVRAYLNRYAAAPGRNAVVFAAGDETARTVGDLSRAGVRVEAIVDPRAEVSASIEAAAKATGARLLAGGAVVRAIGSHAVRAVDVRTAKGETERIACDLVAMSGGWSPTVHLTSHRGSKPVWDERDRRLRAGRAAQGHGDQRRRRRPARTAGGARDGSARRAGGRRRLRLCRPARRVARGGAREHGVRAAVARARLEGEGVRRLPERRLRGRRGARRARGHALGRASEALHHARHGGGPGQDLQRHRPRADGGADREVDPADRHHHLPAAVRAGRDRRHRRASSRQGVPPDAPAALAPVGAGAGRGVRGDRLLAARAVVSRGRRERLAGERQPRGADRALGRRRVRCIHARQDRCAGAGRCRVPRTASTPTPGPTSPVGRARYGLMLREDGFVLDDGTTTRLADAPLHRHHHDGERRQGAAAHGVLPPVAVAGARRGDVLGHRAMGAVLRCGALLARRAAPGGRSAARHLERRVPLHGGAARSR